MEPVLPSLNERRLGMFIFLWMLCLVVGPPLGFLAALGMDWATTQAVAFIL